MRWSAAAAVLMTAWSGMCRGTPPQTAAPAAPARIVLVELFTSEGCSDCPPADQLLRQLDGKRYGTDTLIVGLSEHVTYWDHIGWKDPFGSEAATERQSAYGQRFNLDSVYTPQMVVNGETQMVGNDAASVRRGIDTAKAVSGTSLHLGAIKLEGDAVETTASISGAVPHGATLFAAIAEDETTEKVLAGENRGRTLAHTSVARTLVKVTSIKTAGDTLVRLKLPPADTGTRRHLIVWAQEPGLGRVIGVGSQSF